MYGFLWVFFVLGSLLNVLTEALSHGLSGSLSRTVALLETDVDQHVARWNPLDALQDGVDKMRGEMCWLRGDILEHEDCMVWLVPKCRDDEHGLEYCERLKSHVKEECHEGNAKACDYARQLGLDINKKDSAALEDKSAVPPAAIAPSPAEAPAQAPVVQPPAPAAPAPSETTLPETTTETTKAATTQEKTTKATTTQESIIIGTTKMPKEEKTTAAPTTTDDADKELIPPVEKPAASSGGAHPGGYFEAQPGDKLQSQGFSGNKVRHVDMETYAGDWQDEYGNPESNKRSAAWKARSLALPMLLLSLTILAHSG
jgi:hypothetical protein